MGPTGYTYAVFAASPCLDHGVQLDIPLGFPGGSVGKESACSVGELCSIPGLGRCPGEGNGNPLQVCGDDLDSEVVMRGSLVGLSP